MTIRHATENDSREIAGVHVASWRTSYRGIVPDFALDNLDVESCQAHWEKHLRDMKTPACCFVSLHGDAITGFASAGPPQTEDLAVDGELYAIYLLQGAQRQGVGRALFYHAVRHLGEAGCKSICVWFLKDNPAGRFYERFGGRVVAGKPYVREGYSLPSLACQWDDIEALARCLAPAT